MQLLPQWQIHEKTLLYRLSDQFVSNPRVYVFDLDLTLITPKSGKVFPQDKDDWKWLFPNVPDTLRGIDSAGIKILLYSNQAKVTKDFQIGEDIMAKVEQLLAILNDPSPLDITVFISCDNDNFRKPNLQGWDFFQFLNGPVETKESIFVGDAAGRPVNWKPGKKKDFSCVDRMFAANAGLPFYTPEEFFLSEDIYFQNCLPSWPTVPTNQGLVPPDTKCYQEMVILVGFPGSGKSTLTKEIFLPAGYFCVSQDIFKSLTRCLSATTKALDAGRSVVIDNTNPGIVNRQPYLQVASERDIPVRCLVLETSEELAQHLNFYRQRLTGKTAVPSIAYNVYRSRYEEPKLEEGFAEIFPVHFFPKFANEREEYLYGLYP